MFDESGGQKVQIGRQIFGVVNFSARADAGTIIQQIQQRIISFVAWEPAVRGGIQLPESAHLETLPAADGSGLTSRRAVGWARCWRWPSGALWRGPDLKAQAAMNFRGGKAVRSWRRAERSLRTQGFSAMGPVGSVIAARMALAVQAVRVLGRRLADSRHRVRRTGCVPSRSFSAAEVAGSSRAEKPKNFADQRSARDGVEADDNVFHLRDDVTRATRSTACFQPCGPSVGLRYAPASSRPAGLEVFAFARNAALVCVAGLRRRPCRHSTGMSP